jgi:hypothetical protein
MPVVKIYRKIKARGFPLVESSVVIIMIGIIIGGVVAGGTIIKQSKLISSQILTDSSPVNSIPETSTWLESTLEKSFGTSESNNHSALSLWSDIKNSNNPKNDATTVQVAGNSPEYTTDAMGYLQAVKFTGIGYLNIDGSSLNGTNYSVVVLEKRQSASGDNYFIGDSSNTTANRSLLLGYNSDTGVIHSQSGGTLTNATTAGVDSYSNNSKPRIFVFTASGTAGKNTYVNGTLAATDPSNTARLTGVANLSIGKNYVGAIGEVMTFTKALNSEERKSIEDYLAKKWTVKLTRDAAPTCTSGVVAETGCKQICSVNIVGVSSPLSVVEGQSFNFGCNASGYSGSTSQSYTCSSGGVLTPTPTATACTSNGCAAGYEVVSGVCQAIFCTVPGTVGTATTSVSQASGTVPCNASGYTGGPANYTCIAGTFAVTGNACVAAQKCTGGDTTTYTAAGDTIHLFVTATSPKTLVCSQSVNASVLLIGGGGGGGYNFAGGGGAGGFLEVTGYGQVIPVGSHTITIGAGGTGAQTGSVRGTAGGDTTISFGLTATGGGGGGTANTASVYGGGAGGSGGGNSVSSANGASGGAATLGQGNLGGQVTSASGGAGGGGAGSVGGNGGTNPGNGGSGKTSTITGGAGITCAGGGGGGNYNVGYNSVGGSGGGGKGGSSSSSAPGNATGYGSGGGGGAGANITNSKGGSGSAGLLIVRYAN